MVWTSSHSYASSIVTSLAEHLARPVDRNLVNNELVLVYVNKILNNKMARYDEDLHENQFFNTLVSKYNVLFSEAAEKKWMVSSKALLSGPMAAAYRRCKKGGGTR